MTQSSLQGLRRLLAPALTALAFGSPLAAQQLIQLPAGYQALDVTRDGSIVVGSTPTGGFIWRWKQDPTPTVITGSGFVGVSEPQLSANGLVLVGDIQGGNEAAAYIGGSFNGGFFTGGGWVGLGWLPNALSCPSKSNSHAVSGDGTVVVGLSWDGCSGRGFRCDIVNGVPQPMQQLLNLGNGGNRCSAISANGTTMGGFAQGNFARTPAYWGDPYTPPVTNGVAPNLNDLGEVYNFTSDGSKSVGTYYFPLVNAYRGFIRTKAGAMTMLPGLTSGWKGQAKDMSDDGSVVVGFDTQQLAATAWVWTPADGILSLNTRLAALGFQNVPPIGYCMGCSADGTVIIAGSTFGNSYIFENSPLQNYGFGTPGCTGPEVMGASPAPKVGEVSFAFTCTNAPPLALGLGIITNAADTAGSDPFAIGVLLHVDLFLSTETNTLDMFSDVNGLGFAAAPIPNNPLIAGNVYYAQAVWAWPLSVCNNLPFGLSSSNGLSVRLIP